MKFSVVIFTLIFSFPVLELSAQADSSLMKSASHRTYTNRDTMYMMKLNHSGNLMIAGGVGLLGAGTYLLYYGGTVYTSPATPNSTDPVGDVARNHRQGTLYLVAGGAAVIGGAVLIAFGAVNKIDFIRRKKMMSLQTGILNNGNLGAMLTF